MAMLCGLMALIDGGRSMDGEISNYLLTIAPLIRESCYGDVVTLLLSYFRIDAGNCTLFFVRTLESAISFTYGQNYSILLTSKDFALMSSFEISSFEFILKIWID